MDGLIRTTVTAYLTALVDPTIKSNPGQVLEYLTPDCKRTLGPASLCAAWGYPEGLEMDNEAWVQQTKDLIGNSDLVSVNEIKNIIVDAGQKKAMVYIAQHHKLESVGEEVVCEDIYMFDMTEDGKKIAKSFLYMDPLSAQKFMAAVKASSAKGKA